jgi:hypothetical protein
MKPENLYEIIGEVDAGIVAETAYYPQRMARTGGGWLMRLAAAACFVLVVGFSAWIVLNVNEPAVDADEPPATPAENLTAEANVMQIVEFLREYPSIFSIGVSMGDGVFWSLDRDGRQFYEPPLVQFFPETNIFVYRRFGDSVPVDVPFILYEPQFMNFAYVAVDFFLYDLGENTLIVVAFVDPILPFFVRWVVFSMEHDFDGLHFPNVQGVSFDAPRATVFTEGRPSFYACADGEIFMNVGGFVIYPTERAENGALSPLPAVNDTDLPLLLSLRDIPMEEFLRSILLQYFILPEEQLFLPETEDFPQPAWFDEMMIRHEGALTGAIVLESLEEYGVDFENRRWLLHLDPVEVVWIYDTERVAELAIPAHYFTRSYTLVHDDPPETQTFFITDQTEFEFVDSSFRFETDRDDRRIYSNNLQDFLHHLRGSVFNGDEVSLFPVAELDTTNIGSPTLQRIVHFVRVNDAGEVLNVTQEFVFTQ